MSISHMFPIAAYAEDQQFARAILYTHVVHRTVNLAAGIAIISTGANLAYRKLRPPTDPMKHAILQQPFTKSLVGASSKGVLIGCAVGGIATTLKMYSKEKIEWQDRSWRLLSNAGQNNTDVWSLGGMIIGGALGTVVSRKFKISLPKAIAGSAGLGCLTGIACMVIYGKIVKGN